MGRRRRFERQLGDFHLHGAADAGIVVFVLFRVIVKNIGPHEYPVGFVFHALYSRAERAVLCVARRQRQGSLLGAEQYVVRIPDLVCRQVNTFPDRAGERIGAGVAQAPAHRDIGAGLDGCRQAGDIFHDDVRRQGLLYRQVIEAGVVVYGGFAERVVRVGFYQKNDIAGIRGWKTDFQRIAVRSGVCQVNRAGFTSQLYIACIHHQVGGAVHGVEHGAVESAGAVVPYLVSYLYRLPGLGEIRRIDLNDAQIRLGRVGNDNHSPAARGRQCDIVIGKRIVGTRITGVGGKDQVKRTGLSGGHREIPGRIVTAPGAQAANMWEACQQRAGRRPGRVGGQVNFILPIVRWGGRGAAVRHVPGDKRGDTRRYAGRHQGGLNRQIDIEGRADLEGGRRRNVVVFICIFKNGIAGIRGH